MQILRFDALLHDHCSLLYVQEDVSRLQGVFIL
jgi:hypothetical protein